MCTNVCSICTLLIKITFSLKVFTYNNKLLQFPSTYNYIYHKIDFAEHLKADKTRKYPRNSKCSLQEV